MLTQAHPRPALAHAHVPSQFVTGTRLLIPLLCQDAAQKGRHPPTLLGSRGDRKLLKRLLLVPVPQLAACGRRLQAARVTQRHGHARALQHRRKLLHRAPAGALELCAGSRRWAGRGEGVSPTGAWQAKG